ncbi:MAG: transposase [Gemmatimonadota bacterium]|nr:transposase [Gemmatimonadota bacterium]
MGDFYSNYTHNHKQPPKSGFGFLEAVIEGAVARTGDLASVLDAPHEHGGNPGFPADAMLRAFVMQYALAERYANGFLNRLDSDERLLCLCGLEYAPSEGAYSRFKKKLAPHKDSLCVTIAEVFLECGEEVERLREEGLIPADTPPLGHSLVIDSTDVEAWARPGRTSRKTGEEIPSKDPDAQWGHRTAKNPRSSKPRASRQGKSKSKTPKPKGNGTDAKDSKDELYFGYKVDVIADSNHGLPLFAATRPANASDVTVMVEDLDDCLALYRILDPKYFLADKGYDKLDNIVHIINRGMIPVVAVRLPQKDKETGLRLYDSTYVEDGRPLCDCGKPMEYVQTDPEWGHLFRCPAEDCSHERYVKPEGRLLRIVGLLPRCSEEWQGEYKKRPIIERFFSSDKHSRMLDTHRYLNRQKVKLHVLMSMLSYLATALAHLKANDYVHMRHMRIKLPPAGRARRREERGVDPGIVAALVLHELNAVQQAA